ncbi:MAG: zf-HC2 domain-containing protein, partial [Sedimentisphaerales bacterium]|nr:zf-HC2 domain-containing protein [Sedimentisphaerales bacterium]
MNCEKYKKLIEKYLDGIIDDKELADLKSHTQNCSICRNEFEQSRLLQTIVTEGMSPQTTAKNAKEIILSKLAGEKHKSPSILLFSRWTSIAASIIIIAALALSFYLGRATSTKTQVPLGDKTSLRISGLEGIVLVKHDRFTIWEKLEPQSNIYVGDIFHCA